MAKRIWLLIAGCLEAAFLRGAVSNQALSRGPILAQEKAPAATRDQQGPRTPEEIAEFRPVAQHFKDILLDYRKSKRIPRNISLGLQGIEPSNFKVLEDAFRSIMMPNLDEDLGNTSQSITYLVGSEKLNYAVRYPRELVSNHLYPGVICIGYPGKEKYWKATLQRLQARVPQGRSVFCFGWGIFERLKNTDVGSLDLFRVIVRRWNRFLDVVFSKYPIDTSRVYITGGSSEGVEALSVGLHRPDRIAAIAALSSCVYPFQVYYRYEHSLNCKVLVYRGSLDHQFVGDSRHSRSLGYKQKEMEFGRMLRKVARHGIRAMR